MNDRELLEAAARTSGLEMCEEWDCAETGILIGNGNGDLKEWNPLENDADAFRLMCDLKMKIVCLGPRDAVRRAIVTVAADMGRKKDGSRG